MDADIQSYNSKLEKVDKEIAQLLRTIDGST